MYHWGYLDKLPFQHVYIWDTIQITIWTQLWVALTVLIGWCVSTERFVERINFSVSTTVWHATCNISFLSLLLSIICPGLRPLQFLGKHWCSKSCPMGIQPQSKCRDYTGGVYIRAFSPSITHLPWLILLFRTSYSIKFSQWSPWLAFLCFWSVCDPFPLFHHTAWKPPALSLPYISAICEILMLSNCFFSPPVIFLFNSFVH